MVEICPKIRKKKMSVLKISQHDSPLYIYFRFKVHKYFKKRKAAVSLGSGTHLAVKQ